MGKFTKGIADIDFGNCGNGVYSEWYEIWTEERAIARTCPVRNMDEEDKGNAEMIKAAFNSATQCEEMGFDGQACVELLPEFLETLLDLASDPLAVMNLKARIILAKARGGQSE